MDMSLGLELEHIRGFIEHWLQRWCPTSGNPQLNWHLTHDALSCWLLLAIRIARKRLQASKSSKVGHEVRDRQRTEQQRLLRDISVRMFEAAASQAASTLCMTHRAAIFTFAAPIVLKLSDERKLVLSVALRLAGDPESLHVPSFVREAGSLLLIMLRCDVQPAL